MSNLSDKDMDRLSRDAAEFYEPDDSMLSWNKLEQQLVKHIPERPPDAPAMFSTRALIWGPSVLLLAGITYFIIKNAAYRTDSTLKTRTENLAVKPADQSRLNAPGNAGDHALNPQGSKTDPENAPELKTSSGKINPENSNPENSNRENSNRENSNRENSNPENSNSGNKISTGAEGIGSVVKSPEKVMAGNRNIRNHASSNAIPGRNGSAGPQKNNNNDRNAENDQSSFPADKTTTAGKQTPAAKHSAVVHLPSLVFSSAVPVVRGNDSSLNRFAIGNKAEKQTNLRSMQINRSLVIGLLMGPDYTDVGSMSNNQLGNNIGISVGYYLMNRLSVNTGFQYTSKYYWSEGKPFQPRPQRQPLSMAIMSYAPFPQIESVNGRTSMFEIPLSVRYDVYQHEKLKLFANAGFSSYLLRKQHYTYFFHNAGGAYQWENKNNDHRNYWFAVADISAGLEEDLGKGFSFQAEPFVRLPFRGIGVGSLKMNSYGMLFSIRYSPVLNRKRK